MKRVGERVVHIDIMTFDRICGALESGKSGARDAAQSLHVDVLIRYIKRAILFTLR